MRSSRGGAGDPSYRMSASFNRLESTWASSDGGPGLYFGEQSGERSRFGTENQVSEPPDDA